MRDIDCYVAFFGDAFPSGRPDEKPYVLRYALKSLQFVNDGDIASDSES